MATSHPRTSRLAIAIATAALCAWSSGCPGVGLFPPIDVPPLEPVGVMALAGPDLVVLEGERVALAGRGSRAFGGEPLLSWTQLSGTPVLLTNPSSPLPAFVAPFAGEPGSTLVFELRADAAGASAVDQVVIEVVAADGPPRGPVGFIEVPGDTVAEPGSAHTFSARAVGAARLPAQITARLSCLEGGSVVVDTVDADTADLSVVLPQTLPCAVVIDGFDAVGRGLAPAARIFWPAGTPLPAPTSLSLASGPGVILAPGAEATLSFGGEVEGRVWSVGGGNDVLPGGAIGATIPFAAPRRAGPLPIAGEALLGAASGGVEVLELEVSAGSGNLPPSADGGPDRVVAPGAIFRLDTSASFDLDRDALVVTAAQVLGATAVPDTLIAGAFRAPETPGALLFHVVADDGTVLSEPDTVHVVVATDSENQAPVLDLPAERFAIPGETFAVDGSAAEDPDSGFIASVTIAQADTDAVILLPEPLEASRVELVAGNAGDVYTFFISAYDEEGLGVTVTQTVEVEEAGPYVDPIRGSDPPEGSGNGTAAAPFATVAAAIGTAVQHELPELVLAAGVHAPLGVVLPPRVSLRGGVVFDGETGEYVDDPFAATTLPVNGDGLGVVDGRLSDMTLEIASSVAAVTLEGAANLEDVNITVSATDHAAPLVVVRTLAAARISGAVIVPRIGEGTAAAAAPPAIVVEDGAVARLVGSVIGGGDGPDAVGIACGAATVSLEESDVTGGAGAARGTGVRAGPGCALDVTASRIAGGIASEATGIDAADALLTTDAASTLVGAAAALPDGDTELAVAVRFAGRERSALIESTLLAVDGAAGAVAAVATGLLCDDAQVGLSGARIEARAALSVAVQPDRCVIGSVNSVLAADSAGVRGAQADDVTIIGGTIDAREVGVDLDGDAVRVLRDVTVTSGGRGVRAASDVELDGVRIFVAGTDEPVGVEARAAVVRDSDIQVVGGAARAVVVTAPSSLVRSVLRTGTSAAPAVTHSSALTVESSIIVVTGAEAVLALGPLTLRHATLLADGAAGVRLVNAGAGASLDAFNSYVTAVASDGPPWLQAVALAFSTPGPFVIVPSGPLTTDAELEDAGCDSCVTVAPLAVLDATGHLLPGDNPLVDAGDDDVTTDIDVDGEPRDAAPDIGADELQ